MTVFDNRQTSHKPDGKNDVYLSKSLSQRLPGCSRFQTEKNTLSHKELDLISMKALGLIETIQQRTLHAIVCSEDRAFELCQRQKDTIASIQALLHTAGQFARFCPGNSSASVPHAHKGSSEEFFRACRALKADTSQVSLNSWLQRTRDAMERKLERCEIKVNDLLSDVEEITQGSSERLRVTDSLVYKEIEVESQDGSRLSIKISGQVAPLFKKANLLFSREHASVSIDIEGEANDQRIPFLVSCLYSEVSIVHDVKNQRVWSWNDNVPIACNEDKVTSALTSHQETILDIEKRLNRFFGVTLDSLVQEQGSVHVRDASIVHKYIEKRRELHKAAEAAYCGLCCNDTAAFESYVQQVREVASQCPDSLYCHKTEVYTKDDEIPELVYEQCVSFCKRYELRPSDPRYCQQGGTIFSKDIDSFKTAMNDGAHLICCRNRESGSLSGFLMVYPPETHGAINAHIQKQEHWYGPASYVSFVAVDPELSAQVFQLLQVRMMCEAYTSNIYAGQVAMTNVPSLLTNGYGSGAVSNIAHTQQSNATVAYQGYNDLVDMYCGDNFTRFGSGESIVEESQDANVLHMLGFIRGLSPEWKERIAEIAPTRKEAFQEVRYLQATALPGICDPTLPNLLRLWRFSQQEELRRTPGFGSSLSEGSLDRILSSEGEERVQQIARMRAEARLLLHEGMVKELTSMGFWEDLKEGSLGMEKRERVTAMLTSKRHRRFEDVFSDVLSVFSWQQGVLDYLGDRSTDRTRTEMDLHFGDWPMLMRLNETHGNTVDPDDIRSMMYKAAQALPLRF